MRQAFKMVRGWNGRTDRDEITAQLICLVEEVGEAIDELDNPEAMYRELSDVVIASTFIHLILSPRMPVNPYLDPAYFRDSVEGRLLQLASEVAKLAKMWRQISGMRGRASSETFTTDMMLAQIGRIVCRAHVVDERQPLPIEVVLDRILMRGKGITPTVAPVHTGAKPGTMHWG